MLLGQEERSRFDKFIDDAVRGLGRCEVSHKCHTPWCYVSSHLDLVLRAFSKTSP